MMHRMRRSNRFLFFQTEQIEGYRQELLEEIFRLEADSRGEGWSQSWKQYRSPHSKDSGEFATTASRNSLRQIRML